MLLFMIITRFEIFFALAEMMRLESCHNTWGNLNQRCKSSPVASQAVWDLIDSAFLHCVVVGCVEWSSLSWRKLTVLEDVKEGTGY